MYFCILVRGMLLPTGQLEKILFHWNSAQCGPEFAIPSFPANPEALRVLIGISAIEDEVMLPGLSTIFPATWQPSHRLRRRRPLFLRRLTR